MFELRLGDDLDDFCIKCKRLTNHTIVSMVGDQPAKVRCRACYNDHDFRREQAPPTKKELKTAQLLKEALEAGELAPDELMLSELPDTELPDVELPDAGLPDEKTKTA